MARWSWYFSASGERGVFALSSLESKRVIGKLEWLANHFNQVAQYSLRGHLKKFYRLRVGNLRVIYEIDHKMSSLVVHHIGKRDKVYKTQLVK